MKILFFLLFIYMLFSCDKKPVGMESLNSTELVPVECRSSINDSIFFSDHIMHPSIKYGRLIIPDVKADKCFLLTKNFDLLTVIGKGTGKGPLEFSFTSNANLLKNRIDIFDDGNQKISVFNYSGELLNEIKYPFQETMTDRVASLEDSSFLLLSTKKEHPIQHVDINGNIINSFGEFVPAKDARHKSAINPRFIIWSQYNQIFTVYLDRPVIERFSLNGQLLEKVMLHDLFGYHLEVVDKEYEEDGNNKYATIILFRDVYYAQSKIYLLFWGDYHPVNSDQILVLEDDGEKLEIEGVIKLNVAREGSGSFSTMCTDGQDLFAFDRVTAEICKYKLN